METVTKTAEDTPLFIVESSQENKLHVRNINMPASETSSAVVSDNKKRISLVIQRTVKVLIFCTYSTYNGVLYQTLAQLRIEKEKNFA